ncbi:MAG: dTDP-4-dehydrorhamnose 3,5-epimerase [Candidatus Phosphoribacter sp.]|nr:dTDP-4-dehydrorhamnose 3,5-epimerase family protein [Actinomycetales bacterium]
MQFRPLSIEGAWEVTPRLFPDSRGAFAEGFRSDKLAEHIGHTMTVAQTNISVSTAGAVRGIHYAALPPSQAKYVTALSGVFLDCIVDIRAGSPTFGRVDVVRLDTDERRAVYLSEGLGHALICLEGGTAVYLCSTPYNPAGEKGITPLDPSIALPMPEGFVPILSEKDTAAPTLHQALEAGLLPDYAACLAYRRGLA